MKRFLTTTFLLTLLAISAAAQTQTAAVKIVFMNTEAFYDEKLGITKLVNADKQINTKYGARIKELQDGTTRLQTLSDELQNMGKLPQAQFNQTAYNTKKDEGEKLQRELSYKKTELEAAISKDRATLFGPISQDIGKAMDDFAKKNGYTVILDVSKLDNSGAILFLAEAADVTKEFITFYNARPAGTAAPAKPN